MSDQTQSDQTQQFVAIGEIVRAVGLRGELKLYPLLDFHAPILATAFLCGNDGQPVKVTRHRVMSGGCWGLAIEGVASREAAEAMVGIELGFAAASYLDPAFPKPDGGLPFRWLGREVVTAAGEPVGTVDEVRRIGPQCLLVIPDGAREILIPAVPAILRPDDGLTGPLVIDPPEGLLDVQRG
jgi:16S rRNA processing protein RimM